MKRLVGIVAASIIGASVATAQTPVPAQTQQTRHHKVDNRMPFESAIPIALEPMGPSVSSYDIRDTVLSVGQHRVYAMQRSLSLDNGPNSSYVIVPGYVAHDFKSGDNFQDARKVSDEEKHEVIRQLRAAHYQGPINFW